MKLPAKRLFAPSALLSALLLAGCASVPASDADTQPAAARAETSGDFGVLVMAHGGIDSWEGEVNTALAPLREEFPMEIAYGMADAASLQEGVEKLEKQGVERIGVVRLFISGESWYERTQQILGLKEGAPAKPSSDEHAAHGAGHDAHAGHGGMRMEFWQLDSDADFAISTHGLADAEEMGTVLEARARALSQEPTKEDVLILAHGPGDDAENQRWLDKIGERAEAVRKAIPFRRVQVMTLREDWPEKREAAEADVRSFITRAGKEGGKAIVIPYRVQGFGPYAKVLEGMDYVSDGKGLVPHPAVTEWVRSEARVLRDDGFEPGNR